MEDTRISEQISMHREAKNRRNTLCISRFFNEAGRKICRQDGCGDLFSASLELVVLADGGAGICLSPKHENNEDDYYLSFLIKVALINGVPHKQEAVARRLLELRKDRLNQRARIGEQISMHREAKNRRNTLCISRFFDEAGRKICRQDGCRDLFSASLKDLDVENLCVLQLISSAHKGNIVSIPRKGTHKGKYTKAPLAMLPFLSIKSPT